MSWFCYYTKIQAVNSEVAGEGIQSYTEEASMLCMSLENVQQSG